MKQIFEKNEQELIEEEMNKELKSVELDIKSLLSKRQLLRDVITKIKSERPEGYVEATPVRKMFSEKFEENKSIAAKINYILGNENAPLTSAEVTDRFITLSPKNGIGKKGKKRNQLLKNISTILSIGNEKKYERVENVETGRFAYQLKKEEEQMVTA
jgi:hypothetical protein